MSTGLEEYEAEVTNDKLVPSALSSQVGTELEPTKTDLTPTKKDPFTVTVAPPVFGMIARSV
jgi:hypothetical protein